MNDVIKTELGALWNIATTLADGQYHSGEELGLLLGVSRAAVWKHLQKLEYFGVLLSSTKGRGYCIPGGLDLLDKGSIESGLEIAKSLNIQIFPQLDSTNSFLMRQDNPAGQACFAEFQSAGRGRRGRNWVSPMAQNIYCSVGWGFDGGVAAIEGLSLAIGVAIVRTLNKCGATGAKLKWPNDVLYQDKKLAGILIEMTGDPAGYCQVVIGVGLNVSMQPPQAETIDQPWVSLSSILKAENLPAISRNQLAASLLNEMVTILDNYQEKTFVDYQVEWMSAAAYLDKSVELRNGQILLSGTFVGVSEAGALLLLSGNERRSYHGGEISLRVAQ